MPDSLDPHMMTPLSLHSRAALATVLSLEARICRDETEPLTMSQCLLLGWIMAARKDLMKPCGGK